MNEKRKCIFTGQTADFKATVSHEDQHNWAKSVPCTKDYWNAYLKHRPFNEIEMRLVELFFQQEISKLKILTLENRMEKLRGQLADGMNSFNTVEKLKFYKPDIKFGEEMERDIKQKVFKMKLSKATPEELEGLPHEESFETKKILRDSKEGDNCPNPKCPNLLQDAPGIGVFCPNQQCDVGDDPDVYYVDEPSEPLPPEVFEPVEVKNATKVLISTPKDDKIEKKVIKKKKSLWE